MTKAKAKTKEHRYDDTRKSDQKASREPDWYAEWYSVGNWTCILTLLEDLIFHQCELIGELIGRMHDHFSENQIAAGLICLETIATSVVSCVRSVICHGIKLSVRYNTWCLVRENKALPRTFDI